MKAYILRGSEDSKKLFIEKHIKECLIPSYNITEFGEPLKIINAREIKKLLSISSDSQKRLIIVKGDPNIESQNALLKILEELDEATDFIFANNQELLPTIISRCSVIFLESHSSTTYISNIEIINQILNYKDLNESFTGIERFFAEKKENPLEELILGIRYKILLSIKKSEKIDLIATFEILKSLQNNFPIVIFNNVNPRIVVENAILNR